MEGRTFPSSSNNVLPQTPAQARKRYREWLKNQAKAEFRELSVVYDYSPTYEDDSPIISNDITHINRDLKRALKLGEKITKDPERLHSEWWITQKIEEVIQQLNISYTQRNTLRNNINNKKPKDIKDIFKWLIMNICTYDMPILNKEIYNLITSYKMGKQFYKEITKATPERDYYWYIMRVLDRLEFLTNEDKMKCYFKIKERYDIIKEKYHSKRPRLILALSHITIKEDYKNISSRKRSRKFFDDIHPDTVSKYKRIIKELNL